MRKVISATFVTLDGVMQAPGAPEEDRSDNFAYGGWQGSYNDEMSDAAIDTYMRSPFELLLGKRTYDIFAAYWPYSKEEPVASKFNSTRKYVVSHKPVQLSWHNSTLVTGDVVAEIKELKKQDGPEVWVWGSGNLIQTLLSNSLIDTMHIWIYPITIGSGKRLFAEGTQARGLKLIESKTTPKGVILADYEVAGPLKPATD